MASAGLALPPTPVRLVRLKRRADFERVLGAGAASIVARSPHFVLHHLPESGQLSTGFVRDGGLLVDGSKGSPRPVYVGVVIPKRWARRAVTRNVLRRQMYAALARCRHVLPGGTWVARLRSSFDLRQFPSADSLALRRAARAEMDGLMAGVLRRLGSEGQA